MKKWRNLGLATAVLVGLSVSVLVGCNFLQYQFCIFNGTPYILKELNIVVANNDVWGPNDLNDGAPLDAGASEDIKGFAPGEYWVRAIFDVVDPCPDFCSQDKSFQLVNCAENEVLVYSTGSLPPITTTNLCIDYLVENLTKSAKGECDLDIYASAHLEI